MKHEIEVCRIGYGHKILTIEADTMKEAQERAIDEAGDHEFSETSSDYVVNDTTSEGITPEEKIKDFGRYCLILNYKVFRRRNPLAKEITPEEGEKLVGDLYDVWSGKKKPEEIHP